VYRYGEGIAVAVCEGCLAGDGLGARVWLAAQVWLLKAEGSKVHLLHRADCVNHRSSCSYCALCFAVSLQRLLRLSLPPPNQALARTLLAAPQLVLGQTILEVGSGVGLIGLLATQLHAPHVGCLRKLIASREKGN
jgi:hypothetical protein